MTSNCNIGSKSNFLSPGCCVHRSRQYTMICCKFHLISWLFVFPQLIILGRWNQKIWLVSCRRQGMVTQEPTPVPKCKLLIPSFLTVLHLLDCLICTRNALSIVLLLQMAGRWNRCGGGGRGGWFILRCGWTDRGWLSSYSFCLFSCALVFCCLMFSFPLFRCLEQDGCCVTFFVFSLFSLSLVPLTGSY